MNIPPKPSGKGREAGNEAQASLPASACMALRTYVYVDGFNLYYGCLRKTAHKWLDVAKLCGHLLPNNQIDQIRYFTAPVIPRNDDPQQRTRQDVYLRALRTTPQLSVHLGHVLSNNVWMMKSDLSEKVKVVKTEEKGSDVNIASHILIDAYQSKYDVAVIISNDSDLLFPITHVKKGLGKIIGLLNPHQNPSRDLIATADFYKPIREKVLQVSQFPTVMKDGKGEFFKPKDW